jgi:hypothetical protein
LLRNSISKLNRRQKASVFLVMLTTVIFGFLMAIAYSISLLKITDAEQTRNQTIELKLKLINDSALNEAVATRFYPSSNRLAWNFDSETNISTWQDPIVRPSPFLNASSYVYETVAGVQKVVGRYQYVVLGINPYMDYNETSGEITFRPSKAESGAYLFNIQNPIYVITRAFICVDKDSQTINYDSVLRNSNPPFARCANTSQKLYTSGKLSKFRIYGTTEADSTVNLVASEVLPPDNIIKTKGYFLNRDGGRTNVFDFHDWWKNTGIHTTITGGLTPIAYAYLDKTTNQYVYANWPNSATTTLTLPEAARIPYFKLFFSGAIDERSLHTAFRGNPYNRSFYFPQSTVYMETPTSNQTDFPGNQDLYSGTIIRRNSSLANNSNHISQKVSYPGGNMLWIEGNSPCNTANNIRINDKGELRDTDGFKNTNVYTINFDDAAGC